MSFPGRAYAFFDLDIPYGQLFKDMPKVSKAVASREGLELLLVDEPEKLDIHDRGADLMIAYARSQGFRFAMQARISGTNYLAAEELAQIMNGMSMDPDYEGKGFRGEIYYKEHDEYIPY